MKVFFCIILEIQARMQLLNCVFKDVKMRQERNEIDNLQQRFDV